jgi:hypothetical protein
MNETERLLIEAGKEIDFPASPDLSARVGRLLPERPRRRIAPSARGRRLALVAAALILLAAGTAVAAVPGLRDAVLDVFRLRGATVERTTPIPRAPVRPGAGLELGVRTTLHSAQRALPFHVLVPSQLGRPDGIYLRERTAGGYVSLSYRARPSLPEARETGLGLLVSEFRGNFDPDYLGKVVGLGTRVRRFSIDGEPAAWLSGAPHDFFYRGTNGRLRQRSLRLAANVLLVERSGALVRLEGQFHRAEAILIARSLR